MKGYIYRFTNNLNNKVYIGQTIDLTVRYKDHLYYSKTGSPMQIHQAIHKYGIENFSFDVIHEVCGDPAEVKVKLNMLENKEILAHNSYKVGYNASLGGEGNQGLVHSEETKALIGQRSKNRSKESNQKISDARKGMPGHRLGCKASEETKKRLSDAKKGQVPWNKGLKLK